MPHMVETWRPVAEPGYESTYEVSDLGRVRRTETQRVLKPGAHPKGYRTVVLSAFGARRTVLVHRLVLTAFTWTPAALETRHWDGDRTNNALSNLRWGTTAENEHDKRRHGTSSAGDRNGQAKISAGQAEAIRTRARGGESQRSIARDVGLSQGQVSKIVTGKRRGPHPEG